MKALWRLVLAAALSAATLAASATAPMRDLIEVDGEHSVPEGLWLRPAPALEPLRARGRQCSAWGSPKGRWRLENDQLWLVSIRVCGPDLPVGAVYEGAHSPLLADWVSGMVRIPIGRALCRWPDRHEPALLERVMNVLLERGKVVHIVVTRNTERPELPTTAERRQQADEYARDTRSTWPLDLPPDCMYRRP